MRKALWFSFREPTPEQLRDINHTMMYELVEVPEGQRIAGIGLDDLEDVLMVTEELSALARRTGARDVFGAFPPPLRSQALGNTEGDLACLWEWWRRPEGRGHWVATTFFAV